MLGMEILVILSSRLAIGCYAGAFTAIALVLGCSPSTASMAIASVSIPSGLFLLPFSSREAALSKRRAHKRTRIDKDLEKYENGGALSPLITSKGRLGCSRHKPTATKV